MKLTVLNPNASDPTDSRQIEAEKPMKLLLINPNQFREPLGPVLPLAIEFLAETASHAGHEVKFVDLCFRKDEELFDLIGDFVPDVIGITVRNVFEGTMDVNFLPRIRDIVVSLRYRRFRNIVLGGNGFSALARRCFDFIQPDFAVVGEGEFALLDILDGVARGATSFDTPGLIYRQGTEVIENALVELGANRPYRDINQIPPLTRKWVDTAAYHRNAGMANVQTKRGCPMECSYCVTPNNQGRKVRAFDPKRVAEEFDTLAQQGVKHVYVTDAEFNLPPEAAMAACEELIKSGNKITWTCDIRPMNNALPDELIEAMAKAGCNEVLMTVDTVDAEVAKKNLLAQTKETVISATNIFKKNGVHVTHAHVVGLPGQGPAELRALLDLNDACDPDFAWLYVEPWIYPSTPLAAIAKEEGQIDDNWNPIEITLYRNEHAAELDSMLKRYALRKGPTKVSSLSLGKTPLFGEFLSSVVSENGYSGSISTLIQDVTTKHRLKTARFFVGFHLGRMRERIASLLGFEKPPRVRLH